MARIALFGAGGTIGRRIADEALSRGHEVTAVVRDPARFDRQAPGLTVTTGDVLDPQSVAAVASGQDVVVSAVGRKDGPGSLALMGPSARSLVEGLRRLGPQAPRLISVGGAGSLETAPGVKVWDAPGLPEGLVQIMRSHGEALEVFRAAPDVRWTSLSPAATIEPGERTGRYRTGTEQLVTDAEGRSYITAEDYAVALVDEIENPQHVGERFTVAH
ncbi:NAD(P)H-binding protein [Streptomyces pactum]|uniref:NAD(P)H-binding protein n=1 Tax=Streptomyces pactum TaxID=68249 RepID=A0ABS0NEH5_9ACTN|nr:NAD(P)H-binding protein [Streptomyces pactum]MBH5333600.1 NAD(P)H-binding protein [Streptomyces pactum]